MSRLSQIKARLDAATDWPWREARDHPDETTNLTMVSIRPEDAALRARGGLEIAGLYCAVPGSEQARNATFIANAPTDIEWLLAQNTRMREALKQILGWRELRETNVFPVERVEDVARKALEADK